MKRDIATPSSRRSTTVAAICVVTRKAVSANFIRPSALLRSIGRLWGTDSVEIADTVIKPLGNTGKCETGADKPRRPSWQDYFVAMSAAQAFLTRATTLAGIGI